MKTIQLRNAVIKSAIMVMVAVPLSARAANLSKAVITQKVNKVTLAESATAAPQPVSTGAVVKDDNVVRTGGKSRAELEFADKTLTRLGANTIFSFDAGTSTLDFGEGAALFSKPKGTGPLQIRTAAVTAAITGTTGFVSALPGKKKKIKGVPDDVVLLGILEGTLKGKSAWFDAKGQRHDFAFNLSPGDLLVAEPGVQPVVVQFDLPRFINTSPLIKGFANPLPNAAQIAHEVTAFQNLASRGFIDPGNAVVATYNNQVLFASTGQRSPTRFDAAVQQLTAINNGNNQPAPSNRNSGPAPTFVSPPLIASTDSPRSRAASWMRFTVSATPNRLLRSTRIVVSRSDSITSRSGTIAAITTAKLPVIHRRNGLRASPIVGRLRGVSRNRWIRFFMPQA